MRMSFGAAAMAWTALVASTVLVPNSASGQFAPYGDDRGAYERGYLLGQEEGRRFYGRGYDSGAYDQGLYPWPATRDWDNGGEFGNLFDIYEDSYVGRDVYGPAYGYGYGYYDRGPYDREVGDDLFD